MLIKVGARKSPLSQTQVKEVLSEIQKFHSHITFASLFVHTYGDLDKQTSLRDLGNTDFFTREVDHLLLARECRIAIHSAKDLPEQLPKGLKMIALTKGVDASDSLVMRFGASLNSLPYQSVIATSSLRREEAVKKLRADFKFIDVRGTIEERLSYLEKETVQGVVIAEAALIRLGFTHLNRLTLPGETVPNQGKLAILSRENDQEMIQLFQCIDSR